MGRFGSDEGVNGVRRGQWIAAGLAMAAVAAAACLAFAPGPETEPELGVLCAEGENGPVVVAIMPHSAAERAGLRPGDELLSLNGVPMAADETCFVRPQAGSRIDFRRGGEVLRQTLGR